MLYSSGFINIWHSMWGIILLHFSRGFDLDYWILNKKRRLAHKIDDSPALLVLEFKMPYFLIKYLHQHLSGNLRDIILIKNAPLWETIPDLVTLLWGKWLINGTIATNVTEFTTRVLLRLGSDLKYVMHCQWNDLYHWISVLGLKSFNTQLLKFAAITYWHQSVSLPWCGCFVVPKYT